jgi:CPA1 family monovalent cation:H+ antiporter
MSTFEVISAVIALVALCGYLNHRFIRLPDTIGITVIGLLVSLAMVGLGAAYPEIAARSQRLISGLDFPELVFHGLLGLLLFSGSLHIDLAALARARWTILLLATVGVVLSTVFIGTAFFIGTRLLGAQLPLSDCLIFGALISPTDPIAALGLLRKAGVPPTLLTKITGEALFNDGTGVVVFLTLVGIASGTQSPDPWSVTELLFREVAGGIGFGLALGLAGFWLLRGVDSYAVETLITLAMATAGYAVAEAAQVSAPIAAVVMGLVVGNHGRRYAMSEQTRQRLFNFWGLADDLLNLLLFGLLGLQLMALSASKRLVVGPALLAIPIVLIARAASVALPILALRPFKRFEPHSVKLLTWAGLRGALSVALALSLPAGGSRDLIVAATYVVALFSILVQATTVHRLARRWAGAKSGATPPGDGHESSFAGET